MQDAKRTYRFILSGGGTGGHIYPAIAIANEIRSRFPDAQILFVGAKGKMEMTKVPEAGYQIIGLWISGLQRKITLGNLLFPIKVLVSLHSARKIVKEYAPDAVIGFGGYASGPIMLAATARKVPSMIQEQNSYAGLTNKRLGKKVNKICVAYEGMEKYFPKRKLALTGNPVRKDIQDLNSKKSAGLKHYDLSEGKKTILIIGGSLGARTINNCVVQHLDVLIHAGVQVIWQTGKIYYDEMKNRSKNYDLTNVRVLEFLKEMDMAYAAADIIVSRAGALSISELCLVGKPVIFVPSSNVAEDHQTKNATALKEKDAALIVKDKEAEDKLIEQAIQLVNDESKKDSLAKNIKTLARPEAAESIVNELFQIIN